MFYCDLSKARNEVLLFMHTQNNAVTEPRRPLAIAKLAAAARLSPDSPGQNLCPASVIDIERERMETTHQNNMARSSTFNLAFKSSSVASEELTIEGVSVDVVSGFSEAGKLHYFPVTYYIVFCRAFFWPLALLTSFDVESQQLRYSRSRSCLYWDHASVREYHAKLVANSDTPTDDFNCL